MPVSITTRTAKGSTLTVAELDANLSALQAGIDSLLDGIERAAIFDPAGGLSSAVMAAARGVTVQAAASSGAAYFRNGILSSSALTSIATVTRATASWGFDQSGALIAYTSGQPLLTTAGVALYESRTNWVRNPTGLGATSGVIGSGGVMPTNWGRADATGGITFTVTAGQSMNGVPGILVRFSGTPTSSADLRIASETSLNRATAAAGQTWTASWLVALVGGSLANATCKTQLSPRDGGGSALTGFAGVFTPTATLVRAPVSGAAPATTATVEQEFRVAVVSGQAIDLTLFIGAPQLCPGADINDPPILQTNNTVTTRNADVVQAAVNIPAGQAFTVVGKFISPVAGAFSVGPVPFALEPASGHADRLFLQLSPSNNIYIAVASGGVQNGSIIVNPGGKTLTFGAPVGFAISVSGDTITFSVNGGAAASATMPGGAFAQALTQLFIGSTGSGNLQINSTVRDLRIIDRALSAAECAAFSDVSLEWDLDFTTQSYRYAGASYAAITDLPLTTFSRATTRNTQTLAGYLFQQASGALGATDAGLAIEPARTNFVPNSATGTAWGGSNRTVTSSAFTVLGKPMWLVTATLTGSTATVQPVFSVAAAINDVHVATVALQAGSATSATVAIQGSVDTFDNGNPSRSTARIISGPGSVAGQFGSLWTINGLSTTQPTIVEITKLSAVAQTVGLNVYAKSSGGASIVAGDSTLVGIPQLELSGAATAAAAYSTSYIETTGSAATRNADVLTTLDTAPSSFSVFAKATIPLTGSGVQTLWCWSDGTNNNRFRVVFDWSVMKLQVFAVSGGVTQVGINASGVLVAGQTVKIACAFAANDFACSFNGGAVTTGATLTIPATLTTFAYGQQFGTNDQWGSGIQQIKRWRGRRTNAQLIADST